MPGRGGHLRPLSTPLCPGFQPPLGRGGAGRGYGERGLSRAPLASSGSSLLGARAARGTGARPLRPSSAPARSAAVRAARAPTAAKLPAREPISARPGRVHFLVGPAGA